jgi:hypothetical protein
LRTAGGDVSYGLTECDLDDGDYPDATVSIERDSKTNIEKVTFKLIRTEQGRRFLFNYSVRPGQPSPAKLLKHGQTVRIVAHSAGGVSSGGVTREVPVIYTAQEIPGTRDPLPVSPIAPLTTPLALGSNILASGDLSWVGSPGAQARRILSPEYWSPMVPRPGLVVAERGANVLPRDLFPKIETQGPGFWSRNFGFTDAELQSLPRLVERLNRSGVSALTQQELDLLRRAAAIHVGGSTTGAPFASFTLPGTDLSSVGPKQFRVRVELDRSGVLDVSGPSPFNQAGTMDEITNAAEAELLVTANAEGRILSVERMPGPTPGFLMRYSGAIRWGGRALFVAGIGLSIARVATAEQGQRGKIAAEEIGGHAFGALGAALGAAGCVAFGVATAGVGLFLCGLAGGILLGAAGSAAGGHFFGTQNPEAGPGARPMTEAEAAEMARVLQAAGPGVLCPSCHRIVAEGEMRSAFQNFPTSLSPGDALFPSSRTNLSAIDLRHIRDWLESRR